MLKSLLIVLSLAVILAAATSPELQCFQTKCHTLFVNHCPSNTQVLTWNYCWWVFGKKETCCHTQTRSVSNPIIQNNDIETARPFQNTQKQQTFSPRTTSTTTMDHHHHHHSQENDRSPLIQEFSWGRIIVEGMNEQFKDVKLFPGGAVAWDWRKTGTRHEPGTQPADLEELFTKNCETIILSSGIENRLQTTAETRNSLEQRGMVLNQNYFILQSDDAKNIYNRLATQNKRVCAIIHSTC